MTLLWKARAVFVRDLRTDLSYKLSFALQAVDVLIGAAAFYFLARYIGDRGGRYAAFPFLLVGLAVNGYMTTALAVFAQAVRKDQLAGTLKPVLATPTSPLTLLGLSSIYPTVRSTLDAVLYLAAGAALGLSLSRANVPAALAVFAASLLATLGVGMVSAAFTLAFKRGDPMAWLFGVLSWLLGGVFFPQDVLPPLLRAAAQLLPITFALEGMRAAIIGGDGPAQVLPHIVVLLLFTIVTIPAGVVLFGLAVRRSRRTGTLAHV
jgi:ABC-2 type transport system permease protein